MDKFELFYLVKGRRVVAGLFPSRQAAQVHRDQVHAAQSRRMRMPTLFQIRRVPVAQQVAA
ncbi:MULTISPECIES: hypothetical protein [Xanthomonas translucens group]|uniref:hypothetical protein n=1 Tax=Xanthomonas translucens group TaxID=3390202 RepID=UPI000A79993A|nr:hypothetical protein [Xanthomonas translucens]MCC8444846.1 hypothetical protein [Xanthomonas translucens pv. translucens]MCT8287110.1 hypothetical protein [Xanthomonas translucens pv. translucens]MCT8304768.1 hypothetical protein [Xanthomonas translucens pv. translucens]MQS41835.1 hypothetical protein [Xanthomonas translucens pv. translucens]QEN93709.1 hypothetical protein F0H33_10260 [Xanthomonas translucens pv. undulosa]